MITTDIFRRIGFSQFHVIPLDFPMDHPWIIHQVGGFLVALGADHFDLPSLAAFVQRTELARKASIGLE